MTKTKEGQHYIGTDVLCLTCANISAVKLPLSHKDAVFTDVAKCRCPKCSKTAYVLHPIRTQFLFQALAQEIVKLKADIFELECAAEQAAGQEVGER